MCEIEREIERNEREKKSKIISVSGLNPVFCLGIPGLRSCLRQGAP